MYRVVLLICALLFASVSVAATATDRLLALLSFKTASADFNQTTYAESRVLRHSSGKMWIKRPGNFRWEVDKPLSSILIVSPKWVWNYDVDLAQATKQAFSKNGSISAASFLSGDSYQLVKEFSVTMTESGSRLRFVLTPRSAASFQTIQLSFSAKQLVQMQTINALGQRNVFDFSHVKYNVSLAQSLFEFKPPKGVDVLDND